MVVLTEIPDLKLIKPMTFAVGRFKGLYVASLVDSEVTKALHRELYVAEEKLEDILPSIYDEVKFVYRMYYRGNAKKMTPGAVTFKRSLYKYFKK